VESAPVGIGAGYGAGMRWEELFADLEAQLGFTRAYELDSEVADRVATERAGVAIADRLRAQGVAPVDVRLRGGEVLRGEVADVANDWLLLAEGPRRHLVPQAALTAIGGLGAHAAPPAGEVLRRLGLGHALRALAVEGRSVQVVAGESTHLGRIVAVGQDHLDIAPDSEGLRADRSAGLLAVPFAAILRVSSR
jgi:nucleotide-binding universal stress UspA family protein